MSGLRVAFVPWWDKNPYHELLAQHLEDLGVRVEKPRTGAASLLPAFVRRRPHVLHLHAPYKLFGPSPSRSAIKLAAFLGQLAALRLLGVKVVWTVHNLKSHENLHPRLSWLCAAAVARLAHAVIAHCAAAKQEVVAKLRLRDERKVSVVPHGNYLGRYENTIGRAQARRALGLPEAGCVLLFLGLIRPYKNVPGLIRAFKRLENGGARLVIAGRIPDSELAELMKRETAGREDIKLEPGFVADDQLQVYMNACDAVVLPYREILTSGSALLAMSFGKACIAPRMGCVGEVLDDAGAFLYDPDDAEGLLRAMDLAVRREGELSLLGEHNRRLAERWGWDRIAGMTLDAYRKEEQA